MHMSSALRNYFQKWLYQFTLLLLAYENSFHFTSCQHLISSVFIFSASRGGRFVGVFLLIIYIFLDFTLEISIEITEHLFIYLFIIWLSFMNYPFRSLY